jgi:glycosyltransferase involved in cell wall biosynthesis
MTFGDYVLVTPARNEAAVIARTIESILDQTILPKKWVIISDGSSDRTDDIITRFATGSSFITFVRREALGHRRFSSKVLAFKKGEEQLSGVQYEYLGNLDADVSLPRGYYETVLQRFEVFPRLGIAGGIIHELVNGKYEDQRNSLNSVAGAVQLFRRACYEDIGGYIPLKFGGIDSAAEIMARAHGWDVRAFPDLKVHHHRQVSSRAGGVIRTLVRYGMCHYSLGYHPLFQMVRCAYRITDRPYVMGSGLMLLGYFMAWMAGMERGVPPETVRYIQLEQLKRLRAMCRIRRGALLEGINGRVSIDEDVSGCNAVYKSQR